MSVLGIFLGLERVLGKTIFFLDFNSGRFSSEKPVILARKSGIWATKIGLKYGPTRLAFRLPLELANIKTQNDAINKLENEVHTI